MIFLLILKNQSLRCFKMPYKCEKLKIPRKHDKRIKLSIEDKKEIKELYGKISQRKLAKQFNVSRSLIRFVGDPDKHKQNLLRRKERGGSAIYYDKKKHTKAIRKHRRRKQKLYLQGELNGN